MICRICNKESDNNICDKCYESTNAAFDKVTKPNIIYLKKCEEDGLYMCKSARSSCPECHVVPITKPLKCRICGEESKLAICDKCYEITSAVFDKSERPKKICILKCPTDGIYMAEFAVNPCPKCNKCYSFKCNKCGSFIKVAGAICEECGYSPSKDYDYKCKKCNAKISNPGEICSNCGYKPQEDFNFKCVKCNAKISNPGEKCNNCGYNASLDFKYKCQGCGESISNPGETCKECGYNPHYDYEYKCKCCGKSMEYLEFVCENCNTISNRMIPNFIEKDDGLYVINHKIKQYVLWSEFKEEMSRIDTDIDHLNDIKKIYPNAEIIPSFIEEVIGDKLIGLGILNKYLSERGFKYFAYGKFYEGENGNTSPLVAGKSGSKLVNVSGIDLSYSKDEKHGPSRKFLNETDNDYVIDRILIIPAESSKDALRIEKSLSKWFPFFS